MAKRYQLWNKTDNVITPSNEVFTPEQWLKRYPAFALSEKMVMVLAPDPYNGALIGELHQMKQRCETAGAVFDDDLTNEQLLDAIEAFEDEMNAVVEDDEPTAEERIAAALEYQVMASLPDEEEE